MRKTALTLIGVLLISGMAAQMAAASEHQGRKAYFGRDYDRTVFRRAYNQVNGPIATTPLMPDRFDPSKPGGEDVSLNPPGS